MLLSDQLLVSGCSELQFDRAKVRTLDLYVFENGQTDLVDLPLVDNNALQDWVERRGSYLVSPQINPKVKITAGLRLLCILGSDKAGFKVESSELKSIITRLDLSRSYPADSVAVRKYGRQYVADASLSSSAVGKEGLHVTFISPTFEANQMDITLSYNSATKISHGILRVHAAPRSPLNELLPTLRQSLELCGHPLLLPALACNAWYEIMANQYGAVHDEVRDNVQYKTDLMPNYFMSKEQRYEDFELIDQEGLHDQYEQIHQTIVEQHNYLSNGLSYFVKDFGEALKVCVGQIATFSLDEEIHEEMNSYVERLVSRTNVELNHRERLLAKLDMQVQVLYTLMQQRDSRTNLQIAEETKRDGSAMKTLSLITIVFLPLTAIASVFSMGAFISSDTTGSRRIYVSPKFWIYWAVVLPLTAGCLTAWIVWINRKQLLSRGKKKYFEWSVGQ